MRIALTGSSGTGKTTLAKYIAEKYKLEVNPIGARQVAAMMGFSNPYDVDKAGKRSEFQQRLVREKINWEQSHEEFVTDRTTIDNLSYSILHDIHSIDEELFMLQLESVQRYTHMIYCPARVFCKVDSDPNRVSNLTYQRIFDTLSQALHRDSGVYTYRQLTLHTPKFERRKELVDSFLG